MLQNTSNGESEDYIYRNSGQILISDPESQVTGLDQVWKNYLESLKPITKLVTYRKYTFRPFYHTYVCAMIKQLNRYGIDGLLDPKADMEAGADLLRQSATNNTFDFASYYQPENKLVDRIYPTEGFDFEYDSPYGIYNWELFFHGPLHIANKLSQNQKFEEAQKWLHYIFNPTETEGVAPQRYWRVKPFYSQQGENTVEVILEKMKSGDQSFNRQLDQWMRNPFQPHVIARLRTVAYMKSVVMKYVENLIQWGDNLFRNDTIESLNEATQLYILASQILGIKPVSVSKESTAVKTVQQVMGDDDNFSSPLVDFESEIGNITTDQEIDFAEGVNSFNSILYFCTTPNDKLLKYWDTVADRLFKIRNCQNIEGEFRSLALFEPPIDPTLLVKAAASGLSISQALSYISQSTLPYYRFRVLIQKAIELCNDVKGLGQNLLSVLEKKDAEELSLLRATQEVSLLKAVREIRKQTIKENEETLSSLNNARELSEIRRQYYDSREFMNSSEKEQFKRMDKSINFQIASQITSTLASTMALFPESTFGVAGGFGSPFINLKYGGALLYNSLQGASNVLNALSQIENHNATKAGIKGGYERRKDDWELQIDLAEKELEQISHQIIGAEIRLALSERDLENHDMQIVQSSEIASFMKDKYTNRDLYNWMLTQVSGMYFQSYQLAFDVAKMAERAYKQELGKEDAVFVQYSHWDSLKNGLLAGEKLNADLRRMEIAYLEQNKREFELTKHIPLSVLSSGQLVNLRENGSCDIQIPEVLFDLDYPGQYMRRIKSVRLTIPCVTGPYTNVNAKLTLLSSRTRKNTENPDAYTYVNDDSRFNYNITGVQSIATSSGQNDSGTFELNFQDERYLPFEGAGVISSWRLELNNGYRQFDYDTIADVIIHMSYTSREGGAAMKAGANSVIENGLKMFTDQLLENETGMQKLLSMKTQFPNSLYQLFQEIPSQNYNETELNIKKEHFPHFLKDLNLNFANEIIVMLKLKDNSTVVSTDYTALTVTILDDETPLVAGAAMSTPVESKPLPFVSFGVSSGTPINNWKLRISHTTPSELPNIINANEVEDIYILINYTISNL